MLVDARHGLKSSDEVLLTELRRNAVSHQIILSKVDRILMPGPKMPTRFRLHTYTRKLDEIYQNTRAQIQPGNHDGPEALGEIISCSATRSFQLGRKAGINQVRWAILAATGLDMENRTFKVTRFRESSTTPVDDDIPSAFSTVRYIPQGLPAKPRVA